MNNEVNFEEVVNQIEEGLEKVKSNEDYLKWLDVIGKVTSHSINNIFLAQMQLEERRGYRVHIGKLQGEKQWLKDGIKIKDGETPLTILAPLVAYYVQGTGKQIDLNNLKGQVNIKGVISKFQNGYFLVNILSLNGKAASGSIFVNNHKRLNYEYISTEVNITGFVKNNANGFKYLHYSSIDFLGKTKRKKRKKLSGFQKSYVYDISQTTADELVCKKLCGSTELYSLLRQHLISKKMVVKEENMDSCGYFVPSTKEIAIKTDLEEVHKFKTLVHEYSHYMVDRDKLNTIEDSKVAYAWEECIVESVAYAVCSHYDLDSSNYSCDYIHIWGSRIPVMNLRESLTLISKLGREVIKHIDSALEKSMKNLSQKAI